MRHRVAVPILVSLAWISSLGTRADDVSGSNRILCTIVDTTICYEAGECVTTLPWNLNVPQFIIVDLTSKQLRTTEASGESRATPIKNMERTAEAIIVQGVERERAFSFAINGKSGMASIAVARDGLTVSAFGVCTPQDQSAGRSDP
jgi:hypothetical protein